MGGCSTSQISYRADPSRTASLRASIALNDSAYGVRPRSTRHSIAASGSSATRSSAFVTDGQVAPRAPLGKRAMEGGSAGARHRLIARHRMRSDFFGGSSGNGDDDWYAFYQWVACLLVRD